MEHFVFSNGFRSTGLCMQNIYNLFYYREINDVKTTLKIIIICRSLFETHSTKMLLKCFFFQNIPDSETNTAKLVLLLPYENAYFLYVQSVTYTMRTTVQH